MSRHKQRRLHRRVAAVAIMLVLWFALSGVLLNHAHDFGFDRQPLPAALMQALYGEEVPEDLPAWRIGDSWLVAFDDTLYVDARVVGACSAGLRGAVALDGVAGVDMAAACGDVVHLLDRAGNRIDRIDAGWGVSGEIVGLTLAGDAGAKRLAIIGRDDTRCANEDLSALIPCSAPPASDAPRPLPDNARQTLAAALQPPAADLERLVHDLHSGRLFGPLARWVWDLFALALLALAASGLMLLLRRRPG